MRRGRPPFRLGTSVLPSRSQGGGPTHRLNPRLERRELEHVVPRSGVPGAAASSAACRVAIVPADPAARKRMRDTGPGRSSAALNPHANTRTNLRNFALTVLGHHRLLDRAFAFLASSFTTSYSFVMIEGYEPPHAEDDQESMQPRPTSTAHACRPPSSALGAEREHWRQARTRPNCS